MCRVGILNLKPQTIELQSLLSNVIFLIILYSQIGSPHSSLCREAFERNGLCKSRECKIIRTSANAEAMEGM